MKIHIEFNINKKNKTLKLMQNVKRIKYIECIYK